MLRRRSISILITDLDNTLYDWVEIWYRSFWAMLVQLESDSGISRDTLLGDFKTVFTKHQTTECAFAIEELESLKRKYPCERLEERFADSIKAFRTARNAAMKLCPTVEETLRNLRAKGCLIIAYTESQAFYTQYRMRKLGLDRLIDFLYSPPDHSLPGNLTPEDVRRYPDSHYELELTEAKSLAKGRRLSIGQPSGQCGGGLRGPEG